MRTTTSTATVLLLCALASGCMDTPRNGSTITTPETSFPFTGWVNVRGDTVTLKMKDQSDGSWDNRSNTTASTSPESDGQRDWFAFTRNVTLPYGSSSGNTKYWRMASSSGSQRRMMAEVKGYAAGFGDLTSFDPDIDACVEQQSSGLDVANNCRSSNSPVARVITNCGRQNQACCLANGVSTSQQCDFGFLCNTNTNRCTTPTGGTNEPCNRDNTCDSPLQNTCTNGTCIELVRNAPIISAELVVHTCNATNAQTGSAKSVRLTSSNKFYLDHPGAEAQVNGTDTWGVIIPTVKRLNDMNRIVLELEGGGASDGWCIDRVDLVINGTRIFRKSYTNGTWLDSDSGTQALTVATGTEIRNAVLAASQTTFCSMPSQLSWSQLRRQVEGQLGHIFTLSTLERTDELEDARSFDAWWGSHTVSVTRLNSRTARIGLGFRARDEGSGFEATASVTLDAIFDCEWESEEGGGVCRDTCSRWIDECSTDFQMGVNIVDVDVDADTILPIVSDIIEGFGAKALVEVVAENLDSVSSFEGMFTKAEDLVCDIVDPNLMLCDREGDICGCPGITVGDTGVTFDWSRFGHLGINVNTTMPDPVCRL